MVDTCRIEREGTPVTGDDGQVTRPKTTIYEGKCRLQSQGDWGDDRDIGEAGMVVIRVILQLPISAVAKLNDLVTVTSAIDPANANRSWRIRSEFNKTHATMRRYVLVDPAG